MQTSIIFIDEIDSVGRRSDLDITRTSTILSALLSEMDGFEKYEDKHVIVIAATNAPELVDKALKRTGRFDRCIQIPLPDEKKREALLQYFLSESPHVDNDLDDTLMSLAKETKGWNVPDLQKLINDAATIAAKTDSKTISKTHLREAIKYFYRSAQSHD